MAKQTFVVVDRDIFAVVDSAKDLRKKFSDAGTERVIIHSDEWSQDAIGIAKDGQILWEGDDGVSIPPYTLACDAVERLQKRARTAIKQARKDLKVCRKIRQALGATREFGHSTKMPGPFSGLLKRVDD